MQASLPATQLNRRMLATRSEFQLSMNFLAPIKTWRVELGQLRRSKGVLSVWNGSSLDAGENSRRSMPGDQQKA
jgi:hypothetical protein